MREFGMYVLSRLHIEGDTLSGETQLDDILDQVKSSLDLLGGMNPPLDTPEGWPDILEDPDE